MTQEISSCIAGVASAQISLFGILIKNLDKRVGSSFSREFAEELRLLVAMLRDSPVTPPSQLVIFEHVADWLESREKGWTPVVIDGAKTVRETTGEAAPSPLAQGDGRG